MTRLGVKPEAVHRRIIITGRANISDMVFGGDEDRRGESRGWQAWRAGGLAVVLIMSVIAGATVSVGGQPPPAAVEPTGERLSGASQFVDVRASDLPGSGTPQDPYQISNVSELQAMEDDLDASYVLVSDIDASQTAQLSGERGFAPVGPSIDNQFTGSLDGNSHSITGLTIDRPSGTGVGLFGFVENATLRNIVLNDVTIVGAERVGGVAGNKIEGTIQNTSVSGSVTGDEIVGGVVASNSGGTVRNISASGIVNGSNGNVGGLIGQSRGEVVTASASVAVTGGPQVGGLVGINQGTIRNVSASGSVTGTGADDVGGLVGDNLGTLRNAGASGRVSGAEDVGGLTGDNDGTIRDVTASGRVTGTSFAAGGLVGDNDEGTIANATASGDVTGAEVVGGLAGRNEVTIRNATASGRVSGGDDVGGLVGANAGTVVASSGVGDVNGSNQVGGLVGDNDEGVISRSIASGTVTGGDNVGGLAGVNFAGRISLSATVAAGSVTIRPSQTTRPAPRAGGLVGGNFRGAVVNRSYAKASVDGGGFQGRAGGLVGENFNRTGSEPSRILNSYASGSVSNSGQVGGLVGGNFRASRVVDSYFDTQATGQSTSAGSATGLTTAEMQGTAAVQNMPGLDFSANWQTVSGGYPELSALSEPTQREDGGTDQTIPSVSIVSQPSGAVSANTTFEVSYQIENTGGAAGAFTVTVPRTTENISVARFDGDVQGPNPDGSPPSTSTGSADSGQSVSVVVTYQVARNATGTGNVTVEATPALSDTTDSATTSVSLGEPAVPSTPRGRALQVAGVDDPAAISQRDITVAITLRDRGRAANGVNLTQTDITTLITLRDRAN